MNNLSIDNSFKFIRQTATLGLMSSITLSNPLSSEVTTHKAIDFNENKETAIAKYKSISIPNRTETNSVTYQTSSLSLFLIFIVLMFFYLLANTMQDENTKKGRKKRNSSHYYNGTSENDNSYSFFSSDSDSSSSFYDGGGSCDSYSDSGSSDGGCDSGDY